MKKRNFLSCLLIIAIVLATISPTVLFAAEDIAQDEQVYDETYTEETEEYVEETPEAYDWTIETNELKKWPQGPRVEAEGATVMDLDTGAFLYSKNAEAKLYPASITKIMTMLVALEHISDSDLDTKVKASESALAPIDSDSSQIWLSVGEKITVRSALYAIMLASANDAANVIAEYVGGSMDNFVKMMNDKAKELGCVNTHFVNPHGLHNKKHYTCAHDMALIAQAAFQIPLFRKITKTVEYKIPKTKYMKEDRWLVNHQKMLYEDGEFTYKNCEGGKTGFTAEAGYCYVGSLRRDERTFIVALLACGWPDNKGYKWKDTRRLMEYGLEHYHYREVYRNTVPDKLLVVDAFDPEIPYQTSEKISLRVKNSEESKKILLREEEEIRMEIKTVKCKKAPVKKGEKAGTVSYYLADEKIAENVVVTERAVEKRTWEKCMKIVTAKFLTLESLVWYVKYV